MFPAELATGLCSLNPYVDRLVQSCLMEVDRRGNVVRYELHDGVINSDARMTYSAVNAILTDRDEAMMREYASLAPMFEQMHDLFNAVDLPLFSWQAAPKPRFVRIEPVDISGRRFSVVEDARPCAPNDSATPGTAGSRRPS